MDEESLSRRVTRKRRSTLSASDLRVQECPKWMSNSFVKSPQVKKSETAEPEQPVDKGPKTETVQVKNVVSANTPGSLRDRIKRRLHENITVASPGPAHPQSKLREQMMQEVQNYTEGIQLHCTDSDIGPFFGLPSKVQGLLKEQRGITQLYDWQVECLSLPAVRQGKNLIYSLPTSGGKTLVAEILILRELLCKKRDALLILPFVSIVQEKVRNMSTLAVELGFLVEEYAASKGRFPPTKRRKSHSLYVATIEKAHSLVNSLLELDRINNLGLVVIDELHMLGEGGSRGACLEMTLVKLMHACEHTQLIGMSATLNNISDLQTFISADVYTNNFRPVELTEYVKIEENIYRVDPKALCPDEQLKHERVLLFKYCADMRRLDADHLFGLVTEVIPNNSCLLFCPTKKNCENVATNLCKMFSRFKKSLSEPRRAERRALLRTLQAEGNGKVCPVLGYTVQYGVAYHHSGLTMDERRLVEEAYSDGTLCLLTCTSTLAAGVNLPAKRVILRLPYVGRDFLGRSQYKQMVGRAGRAGIDSSGESILITPKADKLKVRELLARPVENCVSSLMYNGGKGLRGLILSTVGLKVTGTTKSVFSFMNKTLLKVQSKTLECDVDTATKDALQKLIEFGLVRQKKDSFLDDVVFQNGQDVDYQLEVTALGKATFKGSVDLEHSQRLYSDLERAKDSLVLSNHLHLLYLVTPYDAAADIKPSWITYFKQMNNLTPSELHVATLIGVPEGYIAKMAAGQSSRQTVELCVVRRFYLTLMLYEMWRKKTIWDVAAIFEQPRGYLQNLLTSAASFASCVLHFCQELEEFWAFPELLSNLVKTLSYCVTADLVPLMEIPGVKQGRARQLVQMGYKTLTDVARADPNTLVKSVENFPRKQAKQIVASAKILLNEKVEAMLGEFEELVSIPSTGDVGGPLQGDLALLDSVRAYTEVSSVETPDIHTPVTEVSSQDTDIDFPLTQVTQQQTR